MSVLWSKAVFKCSNREVFNSKITPQFVPFGYEHGELPSNQTVNESPGLDMHVTEADPVIRSCVSNHEISQVEMIVLLWNLTGSTSERPFKLPSDQTTLSLYLSASRFVIYGHTASHCFMNRHLPVHGEKYVHHRTGLLGLDDGLGARKGMSSSLHSIIIKWFHKL